jgi:hypothetical protein
MAVHTWILSTWEAEARGSQVWGYTARPHLKKKKVKDLYTLKLQTLQRKIKELSKYTIFMNLKAWSLYFPKTFLILPQITLYVLQC